MTQPIGGGSSPHSHYRDSNKKIVDAAKLIMEIEDILQQKFKDGKISLREFTQLSKRLEAIQEQYKSNEAKEYKENSQTIKALSDLKSDIQARSGEEGQITK